MWIKVGQTWYNLAKVVYVDVIENRTAQPVGVCVRFAVEGLSGQRTLYADEAEEFRRVFEAYVGSC